MILTGEHRNNNNENNYYDNSSIKHSATKTRASESITNAHSIKPISDFKETESEFYSPSFSNKSPHDSHSSNSMLPPLKKSSRNNVSTNPGKKKLKKIYNPDVSGS